MDASAVEAAGRARLRQTETRVDRLQDHPLDLPILLNIGMVGCSLAAMDLYANHESENFKPSFIARYIAYGCLLVSLCGIYACISAHMIITGRIGERRLEFRVIFRYFASYCPAFAWPTQLG